MTRMISSDVVVQEFIAPQHATKFVGRVFAAELKRLHPYAVILSLPQNQEVIEGIPSLTITCHQNKLREITTLVEAAYLWDTEIQEPFIQIPVQLEDKTSVVYCETSQTLKVLPFAPSTLYKQMLTDPLEPSEPVQGKQEVFDNNSTVGVFGGTFDPPHEGHLDCVKNVLKDDLDILVVSVTNPWYKDPSDPETRLRSAHKMFAHLPGVVISDFEIVNKPKYAYEAVKVISSKFTMTRFYTGTDADFSTWKKFHKFTEYAEIVMLKRPGYPNLTDNRCLTFPVPKISSTQLRAGVSAA